ncbi:MAG: EVE domain-containing protein [SAR202 cluster bacterium]|nr:EVE domain-containing protein [Dehalococcoidia bacterium]MQG46871.1 EVE domain-containing protein [SAR202 cluster bacterium]
MANTYWMIVTDKNNFSITEEKGFSIQGIDFRNRRKAVRMTENDRVLYYIKESRSFSATVTVTSDCFEDDSKIWENNNSDEKFPFRVNIEPNVVLKPEKFLDALQIAPTMEYIKKWPPESWYMAFYGMLHILSQRDFHFIENEMNRINRLNK